MARRDYYRTEVATVREDASLRRVVDHMYHYAIGCVVVVDDERRPVGILTDRDLTTRVVARGLDPATLVASDVMSKPVTTAGPDEPLEVVTERMRSAGVRRLPVVRGGRLTGLIAVDDVLVELGRELDDLGESVRREVIDARRRARRDLRRDEFERSMNELRDNMEKLGRDAADLVNREIESLRDRLRGLRGD